MPGRSAAVRAVVTLLAPVAFFVQIASVLIKDGTAPPIVQNGAMLVSADVGSPLIASKQQTAMVAGEQTQVRRLVRVEMGALEAEEAAAAAVSKQVDPAAEAHAILCRAFQSAHAKNGLSDAQTEAATVALVSMVGRAVCA
mmetsp:Transcript_41104/g.89611  ORF Transcript_41104/g.89611 Transcript_41104/m.89611 type:complete len:141 (+) Transcript_41104:148-570(+)|eukprot:CAMPEP_0204270748 /NCGR_PEP_ID=MMETSP0468-20130131/19072_1 /ASSEMBLY_ACC=CAM_ASM_000383 /TAXON_ID=2969 /ORGANISM="Oxyrrhis marina" /LENGTH=140 /DNA_ID=CAMNT_0051246323 /DNA_START=148 /DNA_END=570 /DNA_ORIENTATION=+